MSVIAHVACTPYACELGLAVQETAFSSAFALNRQVAALANRLQTSAKAIITRGHGIASGKTKDARFPGGTFLPEGGGQGNKSPQPQKAKMRA